MSLTKESSYTEKGCLKRLVCLFILVSTHIEENEGGGDLQGSTLIVSLQRQRLNDIDLY